METHSGVIALTPDGTERVISAPEVEEWQGAVASLETFLGLADWYALRVARDQQ